MQRNFHNPKSLHAVVFSTNYRNADNHAELYKKIEDLGGRIELVAMPWLGDPSHKDFSSLPFTIKTLQPVAELSPQGISPATLESIVAEAIKDQPDIVFITDMQSYPCSAVYGILKRSPNRPLCIGLQHGLYQVWWKYNRNFCADFLLCFGKRHADELRADLRWRALPVGLPKLDRLQDKACQEKPFILFIGQKYPEPEMTYAALARYQEYRNVPILVRNHPQYPTRIDSLKSGGHDACKELDPNGDLIALLQQCETVITAHSTAAIEALYLGKPVVLLPNYGLTAFAKYPGASHDFSCEAIEAARWRAINEKESVNAFLDDAVGGIRFDHADRAYEALSTLLEQRTTGMLLLDETGVSMDTSSCNHDSVHVEAESPLESDCYAQLPIVKSTVQDNIHRIAFSIACEELLGDKIKFLDLGCREGSMVADFALRGHLAIGLEGSNYLQTGRAAWKLLNNNLFAADISKPFKIKDAEDRIIQFDIIACWKTLDCIDEASIETFFENVRTHLRPGGLFIGSIACADAKLRDWWEARIYNDSFLQAPLPFSREQLPKYGNEHVGSFYFCAVRQELKQEIIKHQSTLIHEAHLSAIGDAIPKGSKVLSWCSAQSALVLAERLSGSCHLSFVLHSKDEDAQARHFLSGKQNICFLTPDVFEYSGMVNATRYIHAADNKMFDAVIVAGMERKECLLQASTLLNSNGSVFLHNSQSPVYDSLKKAFFDYGHVGATDGLGCQLWCGGINRRSDSADSGRPLPVIISFYTIGTLYEEEAQRLIKSCRELGLESEIAGIPCQGTWEKNCAFKSKFIFEKWKSLNRPLLWVDADAIIRRKPMLLANTNADFAIHKIDRWRFASGTLFFNQSDLAGELLERWVRRCEQNPAIWDQEHLDSAWEEMVSVRPLTTLWLPQPYTKVFDRKAECEQDMPVIEHFQASRRCETKSRAPGLYHREQLRIARPASRPRSAVERTLSQIAITCAGLASKEEIVVPGGQSELISVPEVTTNVA